MQMHEESTVSMKMHLCDPWISIKQMYSYNMQIYIYIFIKSSSAASLTCTGIVCHA
jgi:hypothetical protein